LISAIKEIKTRYLILIILGVWATLAIIFKGVATLELATYQDTLVTQTANDAAASI